VRPVPIVKALGLTAVIVPDPPSATETPLYVTDELVRLAFPMFDSVFVVPLIDTPLKVVSVPPRLTEFDPIVMDEFVRLELPMLVSVLLAPLMLLLVSV